MHSLEDVRDALASLIRIDDATRLYRLELPDAPADLLVERWRGREELSQGFEWWVDALSPDAGLPLDGWLGRPARLLTRLADGGQAVRTGLVREAACIGTDGGMARYRLCLVPWTWLLTQGRHSRVFQERSVAEIVETVFAGYAPLAAWRLGDDVGPFLAQARPRSYCVQYRESDFDFIGRLLAEEGLGWRLEESEDDACGHRMVIFADSAAQPEDAGSERHGGVRFHRSDATESHDSILAFGRRRGIGAGRLTLLSSDYQTCQAGTAQLPLESAGAADAALEAYDPSGAYAFAGSGEAERLAGLLAQAREARQQAWFGQGTARSFRAGTWFRLTQAPAQGETPPSEVLITRIHQAGVNNLPLDLRQGIGTRLGPAPAWPRDADDAEGERAILARADAVGYANRFEGVDRERPWRPVLADETGARLNPRPTAPGYQTAIVVGADGQPSPSGAQELHCDRLGRIRVRFHWQQGQGAGEAADSCWLRVAQRYAGPGVGSQFLPRIGQEVLVAFLEGDIDRPVVTGALYNGQGEAGVAPTPGGRSADADASAYAQASDHRPSAQANLAGGHAPPWHGMGAGDDAHRNAAALWGVKSKEWGGEGHSRLVFDDSDGQLRLQLATTQAASQLNLGHLINQADNYRGSFRGEGFELRTDAWGAVRAEAGLWLSAYDKPGETPAGDAVGPAALLGQLRALGETFSSAAATHQTVRLAGHEGAHAVAASRLVDDQAPLQALLASAKTTVPGDGFDDARGAAVERSPAAGAGRIPHTGDALLGLAAPAGIGLVAGQGLTWAVGETLTLASGQASHLAVAGNLRLHAGQAIGMLAAAVEGQQEEITLSLVTGEGELDFQAQNDQLKLQSKDQLKLISANAEIEMAAGKTIHLATAGGASLTIEDGNIVIACPGEIRVHAGKKSFVGPTSLDMELVQFQEVCLDCIAKAALSGNPVVPL
ncbi:type VI secretion system tip protein VgrG [Luteimonas sp. SJ-92]|uniref:Type VI secretion system tip protein VgrG n=1 Tax=Luteimonas salinisoli TaxID=2752307 RepID=A0A853JIE2_9GAMM|nr:type VI secretion system Vgr family protein [Luteimonas salinisoli]NZA28504.1 type VI secretion system tip protein VgrG [Luteimonas salinisoli]